MWHNNGNINKWGHWIEAHNCNCHPFWIQCFNQYAAMCDYVCSLEKVESLWFFDWPTATVCFSILLRKQCHNEQFAWNDCKRLLTITLKAHMTTVRNSDWFYFFFFRSLYSFTNSAPPSLILLPRYTDKLTDFISLFISHDIGKSRLYWEDILHVFHLLFGILWLQFFSGLLFWILLFSSLFLSLVIFFFDSQ